MLKEFIVFLVIVLFMFGLFISCTKYRKSKNMEDFVKSCAVFDAIIMCLILYNTKELATLSITVRWILLIILIISSLLTAAGYASIIEKIADKRVYKGTQKAIIIFGAALTAIGLFASAPICYYVQTFTFVVLTGIIIMTLWIVVEDFSLRLQIKMLNRRNIIDYLSSVIVILIGDLILGLLIHIITTPIS